MQGITNKVSFTLMIKNVKKNIMRFNHLKENLTKHRKINRKKMRKGPKKFKEIFKKMQLYW